MNLKELVTNLDEKTQYKMALIFTKKALIIWDNYAKGKNMEYVDSVVGVHHTIDSNILKRTLKVVNNELKTPKSQNENIEKLQDEYLEPMAALQDFDWELPNEVSLTFYAIKNLLDKISGENTSSFNEPLLYVVMNQAINAIFTAKIMTTNEVNNIFKNHKTKKENYFYKMICKFKTLKIIIFLTLITCVFSSCEQTVEKKLTEVNQLLPNGELLTVKKTNIETTSIGIISKRNYGTRHNYSYSVRINKHDINWDGGNGKPEPKNIIFCKDTIYIRYLKNKKIKVEKPNSTDSITRYSYHTKVIEVFQKNVDQRYFFNWFGDTYWLNITPENYATVKNSCEEYTIPNDNEILLYEQQPIIN